MTMAEQAEVAIKEAETSGNTIDLIHEDIARALMVRLMIFRDTPEKVEPFQKVLRDYAVEHGLADDYFDELAESILRMETV